MVQSEKRLRDELKVNFPTWLTAHTKGRVIKLPVVSSYIIAGVQDPSLTPDNDIFQQFSAAGDDYILDHP